ncbi:MAG TPA: MBL fold metallo-hydrolase [Thermoflexales bacterium]|nr:MBL fold metallo-hydrolase [Thermoflexales bacterium]HQX11096.1 MBL fold metallo-hydrolase [Thermoflexales bacterium]HQY26507.1 MBL fold metallo-hydrolase [Thermoflexales bacterium]HQZ55125.1 MBL fold metallo-hydrolase [Thermoflexales bacterium]HRA52718.1 MBL fold metallo-hydrolase [Thermoflexales bacterium]
MKTITPDIHELSLGIVNVWLIRDGDGWVLIDTGSPNSAGEILNAAGILGFPPEQLRHVVLTHHHADHAGSLAALRLRTPADATAHPLDADLIRRGTAVRPTLKPGPSAFSRVLVRLFGASGSAPYEPGIVEGEASDGDVLPIAGGLRVIHTPGHSAGHIALFAERQGVLFAGDTCANMFGLGPSIMYEDAAEGMGSLARLATLDFEAVCFGHGRAITRDAAGRFRRRWAGGI